MRLKLFFKTIFLASFLCLFFFNSVYAAPCGPGVTPIVCNGAENCVPCEPPTLPQLEILAVQVLGVIYVMTGLIFFALFVYNGYLYMFNRVEESKKRMTQWIIGILLIMFSQPIVATVMKMMIRENTQCYESLRQPSFTFFFPQVCTDVITTPPVGTINIIPTQEPI